MRILQQAAGFAFAIVAENVRQVAALGLLLRGDARPDARAARKPVRHRRTHMIRLLTVTMATAGILALSGVRAPEVARIATVERAVRNVLPAGGVPSAWQESGTLVMLATGLFGAALAVGRHRK
jgi:hypothetical protein